MGRKLTPDQWRAKQIRQGRGLGTSIDVDEFARQAPPKVERRKPPKLSRSKFDAELGATRLLMQAEQWGSFKPKNLVFLYAHLHEHVYGVLPLELMENSKQAYVAAGQMLKTDFSGDVRRMIEFIRWTWRRELQQFPARKTDFRIGWRYQFRTHSLLTDYRIHLTRQKNKRR